MTCWRCHCASGSLLTGIRLHQGLPVSSTCTPFTASGRTLDLPRNVINCVQNISARSVECISIPPQEDLLACYGTFVRGKGLCEARCPGHVCFWRIQQPVPSNNNYWLHIDWLPWTETTILQVSTGNTLRRFFIFFKTFLAFLTDDVESFCFWNILCRMCACMHSLQQFLWAYCSTQVTLLLSPGTNILKG